MKFALRILNGPLQSRYAGIKAGMKIGRKGANLNVPDKKMSQIHVIIEESDDGSLILKDTGSTNGILVGTEKLREYVLKAGSLFRLGSTDFEVGQLSENGQEFISMPLPEEANEVAPEPQTWDEFFTGFCEAQEPKDSIRPLRPFPRLLEMRFLRGPLIDENLYFAYGPRTFGRYDLETPLYSEDLPDDLFNVDVKGNDIVIRTRYPNMVKINQKNIVSQPLQSGDILEFADHRVMLTLKKIED